MSDSRIQSKASDCIEKVSKGFLGIRSMGLFAPLSYLRTRDDWGVGDLDALLKLVEFAQKTGISIISLLPLNLPLHDNSPYNNASAFILDPVYIGMNMLLDHFDILKNQKDSVSEMPALIASMNTKASALRKRKKSTCGQTRGFKYEVLKAVFQEFKAVELGDESATISGFGSTPAGDEDLENPSHRAIAFKKYCLSRYWLADQLLFTILVRELKTDDFRKWPRELAVPSREKIQQLRQTYQEEIFFEFFLQWLLTEQLEHIRQKASEGEFSVDLMLDQPFAFGSADIWCNLGAFLIDPISLKRRCTQGAPPHRLDTPQHWGFYALNMRSESAKNLLIERLSFYLQFCDFLRIDHLLGYYRLYCLTEDDDREMTIENMGIWNQIASAFNASLTAKEKRKEIYKIIVTGIRESFPDRIVANLFDTDGRLKSSNVILAARSVTNGSEKYEPGQCGWYSQGPVEHDQNFIYTLLSPNDISDTDYLETIIRERKMFLAPSDSIRVGFFEMGPGEDILSQFMKTAQERGKTLVFENLGVVPQAVALSLREFGASEYKPLIFGYQYFSGDHNEYWFDRIESNSHVCFSTHDTITIRGWWEGREKWARKKYYFKNEKQKQAVLDYLTAQGYLNKDADVALDRLSPDLLRSILASVADSNGRDAVIMLPNLFGSGDEGIINMPGYRGFWTTRSPVTLEALLEQAEKASGKPPHSMEARAVALIKDLVQLKGRDSFRKQVSAMDADKPHIICSHPLRRKGSKQIRFLGEDFLVDVIVYGKCNQASVVFESGRTENMNAVKVKKGLFPGLKVFRKTIPADGDLLGVNQFNIVLDGVQQPQAGYLIGIAPGTDLNPLSEKYGR